MNRAGTEVTACASFGPTGIDLGTLGGDSSEASAINNRGEVVGRSKTGAGRTHGFVYRAGVMVDLGTPAGGTYSHATAINDRGQVVGYGGINALNSFLWEKRLYANAQRLLLPL